MPSREGCKQYNRTRGARTLINERRDWRPRNGPPAEVPHWKSRAGRRPGPHGKDIGAGVERLHLFPDT